MAVLMALVSGASFAAGVEPLRAVGSFAVGDPRHRRAEIRCGLVNLLLLVAALTDWVVPWLGVPAWETSLALVVMAVYQLVGVWRNPRNNGPNHWPSWR